MNTMNRTADVTQKTWVTVLGIVFLSVVSILTAFSNVLVLWALKRFVALRKPGHIYLGGLAFADLCMIVPLLLRITHMLTKNKAVCVSQGITELVFVCCLSLHLGCISLERFMSIKFALRYDTLITKTKVYVSIVVLWTLSLTAALFIPLIISPDHFESLADGVLTLCSPEMEHRISSMPAAVFSYAVFMFCFFFCLPCAMVVFSYTYILIASFRQRQKIIKIVTKDESRWNVVAKKLLHEFKIAKNVFIIEALFIFTYFSYFSVTLTRLEEKNDSKRTLFYTSKAISVITALNSCLNPVIYVSGNEQFKLAFKKLLGMRVSRESEST